MQGRVKTFTRHLFTRQCVRCGYDGALLRGGDAERCARCGCDLRQRPARSYAEMEGLDGQTASAPIHDDRVYPMFPGEAALSHKWLAFSILVFLTMLVLGYLARNAFGF